MIRPSGRSTTLAPLLLGATLAASSCMAPPPAAPRGGGAADASAPDRANCRARAEEVYLKQNRDEVYRGDTFASSSRDAPFAGAGTPGLLSNGLSGQYAHEQLLSDCLRGVPGNVGQVQEDVTAPAPATPAPAAGAAAPAGPLRGGALPPPAP